MKITIEICCDESFGERRGEKVEKALEILRAAIGEAAEHTGSLCDPAGERTFEIYGPDRRTCGTLRVDG